MTAFQANSLAERVTQPEHPSKPQPDSRLKENKMINVATGVICYTGINK